MTREWDIPLCSVQGDCMVRWLELRRCHCKAAIYGHQNQHRHVGITTAYF